jgi:cation diffusion facilitator CzcD-associated flavoprotein CzcO
MAESTEVVVVGAGPAGLAVGACLKNAGLDFVILEKEREVASSWRRHYERLHLHTVKQFSSLPFLPFPSDYPRYVPRDLFIRYLDGYAAHFGLKPRFGEAVRAIQREGGQWLVESTSSSIRAANVVIAAGYNTEPSLPSVAGLDKFKGKVIHSAQYANAKPFAGQSVLVIGMGNTGAEIALDLANRARGRRSRCATAFTSCRATCSAFRSSWWRWSRPRCCRGAPTTDCSRSSSTPP